MSYAATIKSNYPMKRTEPAVNALSQEKFKKGPKFQVDATNRYDTIHYGQGMLLGQRLVVH